MKDVIFIIIIGLFFGMGFIPMHMLDVFLANNRCEIEKRKAEKKKRKDSDAGEKH